MENYEKFEQLLKRHAFKELEPADVELALQFVESEDEYESLRQTHNRIADHFASASISPQPRVWTKIQRTQSEMRPPPFWAMSIPAYASSLAIVIVGAICWYGGTAFGTKPVTKVIDAKVDTVFIASKADTVFREKIIYVTIKAAPPRFQTVNSQMPEPVKGINMKEKEELERLLVSGSM